MINSVEEYATTVFNSAVTGYFMGLTTKIHITSFLELQPII